MSSRVCRALALGTSCVLSLAAAARAQDVTPAARASAVELFDEADRLGAAGRVSEACPKYQESYRLDPQLGALLHLADCLEQDGKLASAYAAFRSAAELAQLKADERQVLAQERSRALERRISRLTVVVPASHQVVGLELTRDGAPLAPISWNMPLPVDPGEHTLTAKAPGYEPWQGTVTVSGEAARAQVELPPLKPLSALQRPPAFAISSRDVSGEPQRSSTTLKALAYAAGGAGVVGLGLGAYFMVQRGNRLEERHDICPTDVCPVGTGAASQERIDSLTERARVAQTWATVSFVGAGALLLTGGVLWLAAPRAEWHASRGVSWSLAAAPGAGELALRGSF